MTYGQMVRIKVNPKLYENRRERMRKMLDLNAPDPLVWESANMLRRCFRVSLRYRLID